MEIRREQRIRLKPEGYRRIGKLVFERASRDGYPRCEWCGKSIGALQCHHIRFRSKYGSDTLENLILLCENCHEIYAHGAKEKKYRILFQDCRMNTGYIKQWNQDHQEQAEAIHKRYKK